jgi:hypothetical protein
MKPLTKCKITRPSHSCSAAQKKSNREIWFHRTYYPQSRVYQWRVKRQREHHCVTQRSTPSENAGIRRNRRSAPKPERTSLNEWNNNKDEHDVKQGNLSCKMLQAWRFFQIRPRQNALRLRQGCTCRKPETAHPKTLNKLPSLKSVET